MKKLLLNGFAIGLVVIIFSLLVIADRSTILSIGLRKLVEALLIVLLYGCIWLWVKQRDVNEVSELPPVRYHIQTWTSNEQINSYLDQFPTQVSRYSLPDSPVEVSLKER